MNFEIGSTVGDYQVIDILGAGGMGKVYKVRNTISDRVEAMKVLLPDLVSDPDLADRFLREIKVQASLVHPNIASLHTALRVENQLLMLIEFVEGETLEQKLRAGPLPIAEAVDYIKQVLAALEYAHGHGVIHRDIKPANMMLTPAGIVKLMDFGIAKGATDRRLTMTGTTMGSLYYMSPEQIQGVTTLDARADLYSIGVSLYELLTGKRPFDGDSQYAIMAAHLEKTPVPPIQLDPRLPQMLNDIILMSVLKDPNTRFQTAGAFRNALGNIGFAPPPPVQQATTVAAPQAVAASSGRSRRGLWMGIGALAAVLAVVSVIEFGPWRGTKAADPIVTPANPPASNPAPVEPAPVAQQPSTVASPPEQQPAVTQAPDPALARQRPVPEKQVPPSHTQPVAQQPAPQSQPSQVVQQQPPPPQPVQQQAPVSPPKAEAAATRAALMEVKEQLTLLNARASGIRGTLQRMSDSLASSGHGLNATLQQPADLMNSFLEESTNALNSGDAAAAKSYLEKAERQVEILEKRLNR